MILWVFKKGLIACDEFLIECMQFFLIFFMHSLREFFHAVYTNVVDAESMFESFNVVPLCRIQTILTPSDECIAHQAYQKFMALKDGFSNLAICAGFEYIECSNIIIHIGFSGQRRIQEYAG